MEAAHGGRCFTTLFLFLLSFAWASTGSSVHELSNSREADEDVGEAAVLGSIVFKGKELQSDSAAQTSFSDVFQFGDSETPPQDSQLETEAAEAAWMALNASLLCAEAAMMLKATGPAAAELQVDLGGAVALPVTQLPERCGYSIQQDGLDLVVVVPLDGCGVTQKDQKYVLPMVWQETPVELSCPVVLRAEQQVVDSASVSSRRLRRTPPHHSYYSHSGHHTPYHLSYPSYYHPAALHYPSSHHLPYNYHYLHHLYPFPYAAHHGHALHPHYPEVVHQPIIQYFYGKPPYHQTTTGPPSYGHH
ncbi:unnamed protein product [Ophioblennius macclurei]